MIKKYTVSFDNELRRLMKNDGAARQVAGDLQVLLLRILKWFHYLADGGNSFCHDEAWHKQIVGSLVRERSRCVLQKFLDAQRMTAFIKPLIVHHEPTQGLGMNVLFFGKGNFIIASVNVYLNMDGTFQSSTSGFRML